MITILQIDGRTCPVFTCDVCQHRIDAHSERGMAMWNPKRPQDGFEYVHKGACDDANDPGRRRGLFWHDLDQHVIYLKANLGLSREEWKEAEGRASIGERL